MPPDALTVASPVEAPLQSASVVASSVPTTGVGSSITIATTSLQPLSSKTVTEYAPAARSVKEPEATGPLPIS